MSKTFHISIIPQAIKHYPEKVWTAGEEANKNIPLSVLSPRGHPVPGLPQARAFTGCILCISGCSLELRHWLRIWCASKWDHPPRITNILHTCSIQKLFTSLSKYWPPLVYSPALPGPHPVFSGLAAPTSMAPRPLPFSLSLHLSPVFALLSPKLSFLNFFFN